MLATSDRSSESSVALLADMLIPVGGSSSEHVFDALAAAAAARYDLPYKFMREKLAQRNARSLTMLGNGVALAHLRMPRLMRAFTIMGQAAHPVTVTVTGQDGAASLFVLTVSPYRDVAGHLQRLARLTRMLRDQDILMHLRAATEAPRVLEMQAA